MKRPIYLGVVVVARLVSSRVKLCGYVPRHPALPVSRTKHESICERDVSNPSCDEVLRKASSQYAALTSDRYDGN